MGRTLFWYLFRDMVRIFLLAAFVIAGIMGFGGLLRPLTALGLDPARVGEMWLYLMPAMMTYSMPVAAVFAASVVYGRLSADNELTACRAAGMSYSSVAAPALAMGIVASLTSILFLSFVVPYFFLQAERVGKANVARLIAAGIERDHRFTPRRGRQDIFAQQAYIPPAADGRDEQTIVLTQPVIMDFAPDPQDPELYVPKTFSLADEATLYLSQTAENEVRVWGVLKGVTSFTRTLGTKPQAGIEQTQFGPITLPSPIRQQVKFMDIAHLKQLSAEPEKIEKVHEQLATYIQGEQRQLVFATILAALKQNHGSFVIDGAEQFSITAPHFTQSFPATGMQLQSSGDPIRLVRRQPSGRTRTYDCRTMRIVPELDNTDNRIILKLEMTNLVVIDADDRTDKENDVQVVSFPMTPDYIAMQNRKCADYLNGNWLDLANKRVLQQRVLMSVNEITAELNSRASFGISCLMLVLVGAAVGMLARSADFLSAFAVSVIPALITITLVVAGMQTAAHVSPDLKQRLAFGIALIWSGNAIALFLALWLFNRLRKA